MSSFRHKFRHKHKAPQGGQSKGRSASRSLPPNPPARHHRARWPATTMDKAAAPRASLGTAPSGFRPCPPPSLQDIPAAAHGQRCALPTASACHQFLKIPFGTARTARTPRTAEQPNSQAYSPPPRAAPRRGKDSPGPLGSGKPAPRMA